MQIWYCCLKHHYHFLCVGVYGRSVNPTDLRATKLGAK